MTNLQLPAAAARRVLLADRDSDVRRQYRDVFHQLGCDVIEAADGREALVEALVRTPMLIVLETQLPLVNGPALCEILRSDSMTRSVPIIALMTDGSPAARTDLERAGANTVLLKPVEPDTLLGEIHRMFTAPGRVDAAAARTAGSADAPPLRRKAMSKAYQRQTTTSPPLTIPALRCPTCDSALVYQHSHVGGVSTRHQEQWDRFECPRCGAFEYRHRTRKLRALTTA